MSRTRASVRALVAAIALLALLAAACSDADGDVLPAVAPTPDSSVDPIAAERTLQPEGLVDLTLYFRAGSGSTAHLVPIVREVPVRDDLPRHALELLISGPTEADGSGLAAPIPTSTRILGFAVDGDTAIVDLSREVIADRASVGATPEHEALALAALADTLTEFPAIDQVRLTVEGSASGTVAGVDVGAFWGAWGLPQVLVRDETVIGESPEGDGVLDIARFTAEPQRVGVPDAGAVQITSVRARQRNTHLRLIVEVADGVDVDESTQVPPTRAHYDGEDLVLEIDGVVAYNADVELGQRLDLQDPAFESVSIEPTDLPGTVRLRLTSGAPPRPFWLHTLSSPTRVALDVRN